MDSFSTVGKYGHYVREIVNASPYVKFDSVVDILYNKKDKRGSGTIGADRLLFEDDATMEFFEEIKILDGDRVERIEYSYEYSNVNGFYFRYERDPGRAEPIVHEEYHLHVSGAADKNKKTLQFKTHATNFEEVFKFVIARFYA